MDIQHKLDAVAALTLGKDMCLGRLPSSPATSRGMGKLLEKIHGDITNLKGDGMGIYIYIYTDTYIIYIYTDTYIIYNHIYIYIYNNNIIYIYTYTDTYIIYNNIYIYIYTHNELHNQPFLIFEDLMGDVSNNDGIQWKISGSMIPTFFENSG